MKQPSPSRDRDTIGSEAPAAPGRAPVTARLSPRPLVFRVESAEAARELGAAFGPRDRNGVAAGADVAVDRAAASSGAPLPDAVRSQFEGSLGADLSSVRVHTGGDSAEAAGAVGARAYTTGNDIHFAAGQYAPTDPFGLHLLAHEVAHTVQQSGTAPTTQYKLEVSTPGDSAEVEADRAADAMVSGAPAGVTGATGAIARDFDPNKKHKPAQDLSDPPPGGPDPKKSTFDPALSVTGAVSSVQLGGTQTVHASVTNAPSAPKDTKLQWGWTSLEAAGIEPGATPPAGANATLTAKVISLDQPQHAPIAGVEHSIAGGPGSVKDAPPTKFTVPDPKVDFVMDPPKPGHVAMSPPLKRTLDRVFVGDTITLHATVSNAVDPQSHMKAGLFGGGSAAAVTPKWQGNKVSYEYVATTMAAKGGPSTAKMQLKVDSTGANGGAPRCFDHDFSYKILADNDYMDRRCNLAHTTLDARYGAAITAVQNAFTPYGDAFDAMDKALTAKTKRDELPAEIVRDLFIKGAWGGLGSMGGAFVEGFEVAGVEAPKVVEQLVDLLKDYVGKVNGIEAAPPATTATPTGAEAAKTGNGAGAAAGFKPSSWISTILGKANGHKTKVLQIIVALQNALQKAWAAGNDDVFDQDPCDIVESHCGFFDEVATYTAKTQQQYALLLWETWFPQYAWTVEQKGLPGFKMSWEAKDNLDDAAFQADIASQVGGPKVLDDLIAKYVPQAKANAEKAAEAKNAANPTPWDPDAPDLGGA